MAHIVLPCVPFYIILYIISNSKTFLILIFFSIFLVYKKYQVLEFSNLAMKHDNYGSSMLSNLLEVSYFVMILIFMHDKARIFLNLLDVSSMYCIFSTLPLNLYMSWLTRLFCVAPRIFCIMSLWAFFFSCPRGLVRPLFKWDLPSIPDAMLPYMKTK